MLLSEFALPRTHPEASTSWYSLPIQEVPTGQEVCLSRIEAPLPLRKRMESMGLLTGKKVRIMKKSGQLLVLKSDNTRIALRLDKNFLIYAEPAGA